MDLYYRFDFPDLTTPSGEPLLAGEAQLAWFSEFLDACASRVAGLPSAVSYRVVLRKRFSLTLRFTLPDVRELRVARHRIEEFLRSHIDQGLPGAFTFLEPVPALLLVDDAADCTFLGMLQDDLNEAHFAALIPTHTTPGA